jgi:hypothetical protein
VWFCAGLQPGVSRSVLLSALVWNHVLVACSCTTPLRSKLHPFLLLGRLSVKPHDQACLAHKEKCLLQKQLQIPYFQMASAWHAAASSPHQLHKSSEGSTLYTQTQCVQAAMLQLQNHCAISMIESPVTTNVRSYLTH